MELLLVPVIQRVIALLMEKDGILILSIDPIIDRSIEIMKQVVEQSRLEIKKSPNHQASSAFLSILNKLRFNFLHSPIWDFSKIIWVSSLSKQSKSPIKNLLFTL